MSSEKGNKPSASRISGLFTFLTRCLISSCVAYSLPNPGPSNTESAQSTFSIMESKLFIDKTPALLSSRGNVIPSIIERSYISFKDLGEVVMVSPAPLLNAPYVDRIAAPVIPEEPAMIKTLPESYLCISNFGLLRDSLALSSLKESHTSPGSSTVLILGKPISAKATFPQNSGPLRKYIPSFGAPNVIVSSAFTEIGSTIPELPFNPEGISIDITFLSFSLIQLIKGTISCLTAPLRPVPRSASIIRSAAFKLE